MKKISINEMEKIQGGGVDLATFGCGLGLVGMFCGQWYLGISTIAMCSIAMSS